jgi:Protein of unknown function (DUF1236)
MRNQRNTFLTGFAVLALVSGVSLASAQEPSQNQNQKAPQTQQMNKAPMNKAPAAGNMSQSTQKQNSGLQTQKPGQRSAQMHRGKRTAQMHRNRTANANIRGNRTANTSIRGNRTAQTRSGMNRPMNRGPNATPRTAQSNGMQNGANRQRNGFEGLQGNASRMNVQLNDQQRLQIRNTVLNARGAPRAENVQFSVVPGTVIPRGSVRVVPVSPALVRIDPAWRGFLYFVWMDNLVIVNPRDMAIVAVVPV